MRKSDGSESCLPMTIDDDGDLLNAQGKPIEAISHGWEWLIYDIQDLVERFEGMQGALTLLYPPNCGPHTPEAFQAHDARYRGGTEAYRIGADEVARAAEALRDRVQVMTRLWPEDEHDPNV